MSKFNDYLKTCLLLIVLLQVAPPIISNIKKQLFDTIEPKNLVGLITINDCIYSSSRYSKQLQAFFKDPEIKAILLNIDSGGGAAGSSQALALEVVQLKTQYPKPIIAYTQNLCASGAYYIAAMTDYIVATPSCIIGNIGSKLATQFKCKALLQDYKIETYSISAGSSKDVLNPFVEMTPENKQMLQGLADDCYEQFAGDVAKHRHLNIAQKDLWANGKIFTGNDALKLKLIDAVGNMTTAAEYIKQNILHSDRNIQFIKTPTPSAIHQWLYPCDDSNDDELEYSLSESIFTGLLRALKKLAV